FCTWTTTRLARMMDRTCVTYTSYSQTPREYQRHVRRRTDGANTSAAQQDLEIKPGSKFSTIVHEYVTEPSRIFTPKCKMEKREMISRVWKLKNSLT
ncbi:hypothetical protein Tco_0964637, partial [Tanacetum coccineum]